MSIGGKKRLDESNRTEKFWTATVLPALLARDNFGGVSTLLKLIGGNNKQILFDGYPDDKPAMISINELSPDEWSYDNLQLSTELRYARDISKNKEFSVPDMVLWLCNKYLIVIEAKFFQRVDEIAVKKQLQAQKSTIADMLGIEKSIEYVHQCFLHGGADEVSGAKKIGAHSIITWENILNAFQDKGSSPSTQKSSDKYFLRILEKALKNYGKEFPPNKKSINLVAQVDFIDLICRLYELREDDVFVGGLGVGGAKIDAEDTLAELVSAIQEEMTILKKLYNDGNKFEKRPAFLYQERYDGQSAIEYLLKHSFKRYTIYKNLSEDDKPKKNNWARGARFLDILKGLTLKEKN